MTSATDSRKPVWPSLPLDEWAGTYATLHMYTQIVGKIRLARAPMINHWWQSTFYVTARGLTTSPIPDGGRVFQLDFDLLDHQAQLQTSDGHRASVALQGRSVADFYRELEHQLHRAGIKVPIWTKPVEIEQPIRFEQDRQHATYNPTHASNFFQALLQADRLLKQFRSRFVGKCSPVHFFWGSFDLAVTRFSGRRAPLHPGGVPNLGNWVAQEAYSHECSSCGFWPGSGPVKQAAFYSYAYPEPKGFRNYPIRPAQAYYEESLREFVLPYDEVRRASDPDRMVLEFLQTTYEAAAERAGWNRKELEREYPAPGGRVEPEQASAFPRHEASDRGA